MHYKGLESHPLVEESFPQAGRRRFESGHPLNRDVSQLQRCPSPDGRRSVLSKILSADLAMNP